MCFIRCSNPLILNEVKGISLCGLIVDPLLPQPIFSSCGFDQSVLDSSSEQCVVDVCAAYPDQAAMDEAVCAQLLLLEKKCNDNNLEPLSGWRSIYGLTCGKSAAETSDALQGQKTVPSYLLSKQILLIGFADVY